MPRKAQRTILRRRRFRGRRCGERGSDETSRERTFGASAMEVSGRINASSSWFMMAIACAQVLLLSQADCPQRANIELARALGLNLVSLK